MRTVQVTVEYSYQAFKQAHALLRSNVRPVSVPPNGNGTWTFEAITEERWPVAVKHYRAQAAFQHKTAKAALAQNDAARARFYMDAARMSRIALSDAKTGMVTDPDTMQPFSF